MNRFTWIFAKNMQRYTGKILQGIKMMPCKKICLKKFV